MRKFGDGNEFWCMSRGRWNWNGLRSHLQRLERHCQSTVLFGTAFAWVHFLDWCAPRRLKFHLPPRSLVLETGGYKGRSRELSSSKLHQSLTRLLNTGRRQVCSEYSMCEISSQAYTLPPDHSAFRVPRSAFGKPVFQFPPWCRHRIVHPGTSRPVAEGERGVLEILDMANLDSCAFIRTEDLAITRGSGFELVGRLPRAGLKGCSLAFETS